MNHLKKITLGLLASLLLSLGCVRAAEFCCSAINDRETPTRSVAEAAPISCYPCQWM